jgi:general L-amino acid transport system permease protein
MLKVHSNSKQSAKDWLFQFILLIALGLFFVWLGHQTWINLKSRGIQSGFDFLLDSAGFDIGETTWMDFDSEDSYLMAFMAGLFNTLKVSLLGIVISSLIGLSLGLAASSKIWILKLLSRLYIEIIRNVPLLIQLLSWYVLWVEYMPTSNAPYVLFNSIFVSQEGLSFWGWVWMIPAQGGVFDGHLQWNTPVITSNGIESALNATPEFLSLLIALSIYTSAFVAEIVRAGISSVSKGQILAAQSLGLRQAQVDRWVVLPQATRLIFPPLTNQYLNLLKNSSLAVAVGFPDLVSIGNTALNQTGRAVECITILMLVYLSLSLIVSFLMNRIGQSTHNTT